MLRSTYIFGSPGQMRDLTTCHMDVKVFRARQWWLCIRLESDPWRNADDGVRTPGRKPNIIKMFM